MTVASMTNRQDFTCTGSTGPIGYPNRLDTGPELQLWVRNAAGLKQSQAVYNVDYFVSIATDFESAVVNLSPGFASLNNGKDCSLLRVIPLVQEFDVTGSQTFSDGELEKMADRDVMRIQQIAEDLAELRAAFSIEVAPVDLVTAVAAAEAAAAQAAASLDFFDDRFLGGKTADPALDNDGNALVAGALYFNTLQSALKVWNGVSWQVIASGSARIKLTAPKDLYLSPAGSDTTGTGEIGSPWRSTQKAYDTLISSYDLAGQPVTVNMANGSYPHGLLAFGKCFGQTSFNDVWFKGNEVTPANVIVEKAGPPPTDFYCFAAAFGAQIKITGMKLQQGPTGAQDLVQAASQSVVGIGKVIFGDSINPWTDLIAYDGGIIYVIDNYTIDKTFALPTGNTAVGNTTITGVSNFTGLKLWQGVFSPGNIANDTWVTGLNPGAGTVTISRPAIATTPGASIAFLNGGVCHCTAGRNGIIDYMTNGEAIGRTVTIANLCAYFQGFQFVNGGRMDMQAVNFAGAASVFGIPTTARANAVNDNYREGVGGDYPPGNLVFFDGANVTNGDEQITIAVTAGVARGQFINGFKSVNVTFTAGLKTATVASNAHIEAGCKIAAANIPAGTDVLSITGVGPFTITMQNAATISGTVTAKITGAGVKNGTYIKKIVGTTCHLSQPAISTHVGLPLACGGLQESGGQLV